MRGPDHTAMHGRHTVTPRYGPARYGTRASAHCLAQGQLLDGGKRLLKEF